MIEQISVYMSNEKGAVLRVLSLLAEADINVLGLVSKDSAEFCTLRLILSDAKLGLHALEGAGYVCHMGCVIGVELGDTPGALERLLKRFELMNVNIDYLYVGYARESSMPVIVISCEYAETVQDNLRTAGYVVH